MTKPEVNLIICAPLIINGLGGMPFPNGLLAIAGVKTVYSGKASTVLEFPGAKLLDLSGVC